MANVLTVNEVLDEIRANRKENGEFEYKRFNKKSFEKLLKAMANDPEFKTECVKVKNKELDTVEQIEVSKNFRSWIKKVLINFGVDKTEAEKILTGDFQFTDMSGLYEFFATAMYLYVNEGNKFDFIPKPDFKASIFVKNVAKSVKTAPAHSPSTREYLGDFETTKEAHKVLAVKSSCPSYLKSRKKVK